MIFIQYPQRCRWDDLPDGVPELCQFLFISWVERERRFWLDQDAILELPAPEHERRRDAGVLYQDRL